MNKTYDITMQTPIGVEKGKVTFVTEGENLSGVLSIMGVESKFSEGKIEGDKFNFSGKINKLLSTIDYTVNGTINGDSIEAKAITKFGVLMINGKSA